MPCKLPDQRACLVDQVLRPDHVLFELLHALIHAENLSPPPMTLCSALEMLDRPAARIAQQGLNWPSAGHGAAMSQNEAEQDHAKLATPIQDLRLSQSFSRAGLIAFLLIISCAAEGS